VKLVNIAERMWVLDGRPKTDPYNKPHLTVDMSNFMLCDNPPLVLPESPPPSTDDDNEFHQVADNIVLHINDRATTTVV
jgi:hypothetical protein